MKRWLLAVAALLPILLAGPAVAKEPKTIVVVLPRTIALPASNGRSIPVTVWAGSKPKGVIIFGHGLGGTPQAYQAMIGRWIMAGYTIVAPQAVDSLANPDREKFDRRAGFGARVEDLAIVRAFVAKQFPGAKVALAGHSYGSLFALYGAGAVTPMGPLGGPPVAAVLDFSSPGAIAGLVTPTTYKSVKVPLMMITGDHDVVPGFVPNPADHRLPFDQSAAGGKYLVTVKGGGHDFVTKDKAPAFAEVAKLGTDFLDAYVAGDAKAKARLAAAKSDTLLTLERR